MVDWLTPQAAERAPMVIPATRRGSARTYSATRLVDGWSCSSRPCSSTVREVSIIG